jgi:hypothetical protein
MASNPAKSNSDSEPRSRGGLPSSELQQLWFSLIRREWQSLVVVPADGGLSAMSVGRALAEIGGVHRNSPVKLLSGEGMDLTATSRMILEMTDYVAHGGMVIVVVDSVVKNQAGIPVALAADAALLCVSLGESTMSAAERTLELLGRDRFLGSVTLNNPR